MHLAYLDETGTDGYSPIVMFGALIVPVGKFGFLSSLHDTAIQQILPIERINEFKEFHAHQLYRGTEVFEGIDETKRFAAIQVLLSAVKLEKLPFIYAAVDRQKFTGSPFGSMRPLVVAFHMCLLGVEDWATSNHSHKKHPALPEDTKIIDWGDTFLCILDECKDGKLKGQFKQTYRTLRTKHPFVPTNNENRLWHAHDDMFFADSTDCLGIQIADLCSYFVRMRLDGSPEPQNFYEIFAEQVICARPKPEWTQYSHLFRTHEEVNKK